jgi:Tfp pilus assembly protein PilN
MIQFNLLPDVKLQYLKARRMQHVVITASLVGIVVSLFVLVVLIGTVDVFQKKNMSDLKRDIASSNSQLTSTPNLTKILTVQNQLQALTALHNNKPVASRLFDFVKQVTPSSVSISQLSVDFAQHIISIAGGANSLDIVNTYADTLKFTKYTRSNGSTANAFSSVVLSQFQRNTSGASFTITTNFDPAIFDAANNVTLTVPNIISTRSAIDQPTDLFKSGAASKPGSQ